MELSFLPSGLKYQKTDTLSFAINCPPHLSAVSLVSPSLTAVASFVAFSVLSQLVHSGRLLSTSIMILL